MLRNAFVFSIVAVGAVYAVRSPYYALLFYLWNAYFRPEQWVWSDVVASLNLSFVIGWALVAGVVLSGQKPRLDLRVLVLLLFLIDTLLSTMSSEHQAWSWLYWQPFGRTVLITYLIVVLVTDEKKLRLALFVIALSLGLEAAKQGWAEFILHPGGRNTNPHPVLGDNNGVAQGMMMLVPIFSVLAQTASRRWEKYLHRFMLGGVFLRGISTYSRGGFLAAGAIGLAALARSRRRIRVLVSIVVLAGIVFPVMPHEFWTRISTITAPEEQQDESAQGRFHFWHTAVDMAATRPLTGVGFNGFEQSYDRYDSTGGAYGHERAVHSSWFGVLGELGFPGLILFLTQLLLAFRTCQRVRRAARTQPEIRPLAPYAVALETSLVAYVVGGTFLNAQYSEMFFHVIGLNIAMYGMLKASTHRVPERSPAWSAVPQLAQPGAALR
jgi:probable O-glycosylation ligase (exosortase A-associated)